MQREKGRKIYTLSIYRKTCEFIHFIAFFYNVMYRTDNIPLNMDCLNPFAYLKQI